MISLAALVGLLHGGPLIGISTGWSQDFYAGITLGAQVATSSHWRVGGYGEFGVSWEKRDTPPNPAYWWDDNVDRCREASSGKFAKSELCKDDNFDLIFVGGWNMEALYPASFLNNGKLLGGGLRLGQGVQPYVVLQSSDEGSWQWCLRGGYGYAAIEARVQGKIF